MELTILELARAVNKSETYVRQHVHRKHLAVRREGHRILVALDEAARWARARGLSFVSPVHAAWTAGEPDGRTARMTVLAWYAPGAPPRNLFTIVRHRRRDALGPWASEPEETWSRDDLGHELCLFSFDGSFARCQALVDQILSSGTLEMDQCTIHYDLKPVPRRHWAYRDQRRLAEASVLNPFSKHSAEIIEYWSFAEEPRKRWLEVLESLQGKGLPPLARLGFPLDRRLDRVGNLMIAGAEDAITCHLVANCDRTLRFQVDGDDLLPDAYHAVVWASHSGDEVTRQAISVRPGPTVIPLPSEVDHIGFAVYRTADGQCVDMMEVDLIMEVSISVVYSGPTLRFHRLHEVHPFDHRSTVRVEWDHDRAELDQGIRQQWLRHRIYEQEAAARREGNLKRFGPGEFKKAAQYFLGLLRQGSDRQKPIYLADRYFMARFDKDKKEPLEQFYLDMFAATVGRPFLILCTSQDKDVNPTPWWSSYPDDLTRHVEVRAFHKHDQQPGFHDRYLVTPEREVLITNSLNGWLTDGVTFDRLPYDLYRAKAEWLWSLEIDSAVAPLRVRRVG